MRLADVAYQPAKILFSTSTRTPKTSEHNASQNGLLHFLLFFTHVVTNVATNLLCLWPRAVGVMAGTTGTHDLGGLEDDGAIDIASGNKKYQLWELQTYCLVTLLCKQGLLTVDEVCYTALLFIIAYNSAVLHLGCSWLRCSIYNTDAERY